MGIRPSRRISAYVIVAFWLLFSVALAGWWVYFAYGFLSSLALENLGANADLVGKRTMLVSEGLTLILFLLAGGAGLAYYVLREERRNRQIKQFFAAFNHELKTPIASLRLQAESLDEDLAGKPEAKLAQRLVRDSVRLELQVDNSLMLANVEELGKFRMETLNLDEILTQVARSWPELNITVEGKAEIRGDRRALGVVIKNIAHNAIVHGKAKSLAVRVLSANRGGRVVLEFSDDGVGFSGDPARLGRLFDRPSSTSGSGIGLYLSRELISKMGGAMQFGRASTSGLQVSLETEGKML